MKNQWPVGGPIVYVPKFSKHIFGTNSLMFGTIVDCPENSLPPGTDQRLEFLTHPVKVKK